jgi:hypothetical protein
LKQFQRLLRLLWGLQQYRPMHLHRHRLHLLTNFRGHYHRHYYLAMGLLMEYFPYLREQQNYHHNHHQNRRPRRDFVVHYHHHHRRQQRSPKNQKKI